MKKILKKLDFLGSSKSFLIKSKIRNRSWKGGLTIVLLILISIFFIIFELYKWFNLEYTITNFSYFYDRRPSIQINHSSFMIAFCIGSEKNSTLFDDEIEGLFNETLSLVSTIRLPYESKTKLNIPISKCTQKSFPKSTINEFQIKLYKNCKCASNDDLKKYNISYNYRDTYTTFLSYEVKFNDEIYQNISKYNESYDYLSNNPVKSVIYYVDSVADLKSYSDLNIFTHFMNYQMSIIHPDIFSNYDVFLSKISAIFDDTIMNFKSKLKFNLAVKPFIGITLERILNYYTLKDNSVPNQKNSFLSVQFRASNKEINLGRTARKLNEFLGQTFSVLLLIRILIGYINEYINEIESKSSTISKIFKNFDLNKIMMKKIRIIQDDFNEVEYNHDPNFNEETNINFHTNRELKDKINSRELTIMTEDLKAEQCVIKRCKIEQITIKANEQKKSNNDPIIYKKYNKDIELMERKIKITDHARESGFKLNFSEILCKCIKTQKKTIRLELFLNANSFYEYYLDITTYFKKMMEIDIIKYFLFTQNERELISILSNPDLTVSNEFLTYKLKSHYKNFNHKVFENTIGPLLKNIIVQGRNRKKTTKLLQLVQNGYEAVLDY